MVALEEILKDTKNMFFLKESRAIFVFIGELPSKSKGTGNGISFARTRKNQNANLT